MSSTHRGAVRNDSDFYATPESAFKPLLRHLPETPDYWEPSCGDGRLVRWLKESGRNADGADLISYPPWDYPTVDFLKDTTRRAFIITNPPFTLAFEFCQHAVAHAEEVVMLLRLNFLASQKRKAWFTANEPSALFVLTKRPDFTGGGGDSCDYAWFAWSNRMRGIHHL